MTTTRRRGSQPRAKSAHLGHRCGGLVSPRRCRRQPATFKRKQASGQGRVGRETKSKPERRCEQHRCFTSGVCAMFFPVEFSQHVRCSGGFEMFETMMHVVHTQCCTHAMVIDRDTFTHHTQHICQTSFETMSSTMFERR